jgi:hypothetical protein
VTAADYLAIDNGFNSGGTLSGWQNGDFNYDDQINGDDYTLIDNSFNMHAITLLAAVATAPLSITAARASPPKAMVAVNIFSSQPVQAENSAPPVIYGVLQAEADTDQDALNAIAYRYNVV